MVARRGSLRQWNRRVSSRPGPDSAAVLRDALLDTYRAGAIIAGMQRTSRAVTRIGALLLVTAVAAAWGEERVAAGGGGEPAAGAGGEEQAAGGAAQAGGQPRRQGLYPALQRPPGDPELIARGRGIYGINCRACHGVDLRGGDLGGPNLLRSQLVLRDIEGELMGPVIRNGSTAADGSGMPPVPLSDEDVRGGRRVHPRRAFHRDAPGRPPGGRAGGAGHPGRGRGGRRGLLRRAVRLVSFPGRRPAGHRLSHRRAEGAPEHLGARRLPDRSAAPGSRDRHHVRGRAGRRNARAARRLRGRADDDRRTPPLVQPARRRRADSSWPTRWPGIASCSPCTATPTSTTSRPIW